MGCDAFGEVMPVEAILCKCKQPEDCLADRDIPQTQHFGSPAECEGTRTRKSPSGPIGSISRLRLVYIRLTKTPQAWPWVE